MSRFTVLVLVVVGLALALTACGKTSPTTSGSVKAADLALRRLDLVFVTHALEHAQASVQLEVNASRQPWSLIAHGFPSKISDSLRSQVSVASSRANNIKAPGFMVSVPGPIVLQKPRLTGPAAGVAGLFQSYASLSRHGWKIIGTVLDGLRTGQPQATRFLHANADLYLSSVYDGHFDLALIGKSLFDAYNQLGGSKLFGNSLTEAQIQSLEQFYGKDLRLEPHGVYEMR
ncbi:MAG: hypothetical protein ACRDK2_02890 [Solirubrobacteraceae bacterium]